jgi:hypothetical protein
MYGANNFYFCFVVFIIDLISAFPISSVISYTLLDYSSSNNHNHYNNSYYIDDLIHNTKTNNNNNNIRFIFLVKLGTQIYNFFFYTKEFLVKIISIFEKLILVKSIFMTYKLFYNLLQRNFPHQPTLKQDIFLQKIANFVMNSTTNDVFVFTDD